jgi:serine/threonine protein kinase
MSEIIDDPYIGLKINEHWILTEKVGQGKIGSVYKAIREKPYDILACKIIPDKLKSGWDKELEKVTQLRGVNNVVQYHSHGASLDKNNNTFVWILWSDFIDGINLKSYIENKPWPIDIAFIENISDVIFNVLFACQSVSIVHGDLHAGNILISNPDIKTFDRARKIWVSDFGYGGSHNNKMPKDDFKQFASIVLTLLENLKISNLNKRDRIMYHKLKFFFQKRVLEYDPMQGKEVRNIELLIQEFRQLNLIAKQESEFTGQNAIKEPGDYLWAEALGNNKDEWKGLFVPEFLAARELLNKDITILTGARGCGKTMVFRRLTAYMDALIGEPSNVVGANQFVGFYLNCRNLIEAFPWIPENITNKIEAQLIHYFHLCWLSEILNTLYICFNEQKLDYKWLDKYISNLFKIEYESLPEGAHNLAHIMAFVEDQKEKCRLTTYNKINANEWPLYKINFLDELQELISNSSIWSPDKPFYFFLDDYTIPIIPRNVQKALNPIIYKRRDRLFFKISTESFLSFERTFVRGKPLEAYQDFHLIDLASESLHFDSRDKRRLIDKLFKPRIERHELLKNQNLSLEDILGRMNMSSNELAWQIRNSGTGGVKKKVLYFGIESFVGIWSSDIRIMIQMFVSMLTKSDNQLKNGKRVIDPKIQNDTLRTSGGEFLVFAESVSVPSSIEKSLGNRRNIAFGTHLIKIVETFIQISKFELVNGKLISNQGRLNPKQAFRLEIIDKFELSDDVKDFYEGLVRWHIFLFDWRGKSLRGMITPRLFLNRILIPNAQLTFSSHDNIHMNNQEFNRFLKDPKQFYKYWILKRKRIINIHERKKGQNELDFNNGE